VFALAGWTLAAGACVLAAVLWMAARSTRALSGKPGHPGVLPAVLLGAAGVLGEGLGFSFAARALFAGFEPWQAFLTYALLLTAFELSPAPLALGILELAGAVASLVLTGSHWAGAVLACLYRLWRATPVCLLVLFYMPRYKMRPRDLFDPELPAVLARLRQRPGEADDRAAGPLLSVVLPAYNEEQRLPQYLPQVIEFCRRLEGGAEIVVVDDGSRDGTAAYIERGIAAEPTLRLVRMGQNQGKGAAVCRGVREAHGSYVLFADADGATPIGEATKLIEAAARGADVVIGSRKAAAAGVARERSWLRELAGTVFYRITNLLAVPHVEDTQCGFKLFRRSAAGPIFALVTEKGWAFDVQVLFLAQKLGFQIEEVPVNWRSVEGSKIRSSDALRMFAALFRIRRRSAGLTGDGDGA
jgi:dolichyl-phosphate beta-glucosyltransferase